MQIKKWMAGVLAGVMLASSPVSLMAASESAPPVSVSEAVPEEEVESAVSVAEGADGVTIEPEEESVPESVTSEPAEDEAAESSREEPAHTPEANDEAEEESKADVLSDAETPESEPEAVPEAETDPDYNKEYVYQDESVLITAAVTEEGIIPESAEFYARPIDMKSDEYLALREKVAAFYGFQDDLFEIYPYDLGFREGTTEIEPKFGNVNVRFEFAEPIEIRSEEVVEVVHMKEDEEPEVLADDVVENGTVSELELEMESFSPVVVTKSNIKSTPLKSIQKEDENGNTVIISKTPNVNADGTASSYYGNNQNLTDTIDLSDALGATVVIQYRTESTSWDWLYIQDANGNILKKDSDGTQIGDTNGKIGGGGTNNYTPSNTVTYHFNENVDTLKFVWRSDTSAVSYGYYAVITPVYPTSDIPDYHVEELEDGTYALVFDKGGDIEAFVSRPEVKERLAPYLNKISEIRLHKDTTSIDKGAFKGLTALKNVTVPRNAQLQKIGTNVFNGCENLESIAVPATVTEIEGSAFTGCVSMESVSFASGSPITELPDGLFKGLTSLKTVTLPEGITEIPDECFYGCTALTDIDVPSGVTRYGKSAFQNTSLLELPDFTNVTEIRTDAFSGCKKITSVHIPASVTTLGAAFRNCENVEEFVFEEGTHFEKLEDNFFSNMKKLKTVSLPDGLKATSSGMFSNCSVLEHVDLPDTLVTIANSTFYACYKLQDFEVPSGVKTIGTSAFYDCDALTDIVIPKTVTSVGSDLFRNCGKLIRVRFEEGSPISTLPSGMFNGCSKLETVKLPDGVTSIPASYFRSCTSLRHVDYPANLTSIGEYAFYDCKSLEDPVFPPSLNTIGRYAYSDCDSIQNVVIPNSVTSVGSNAFYECSDLRSLVFEEGSQITSLNEYFATDCRKLETLVLPEKLTSLPRYMARNCLALKDVVVPSTITSVGQEAFYNCQSLTRISLPDTCTTIGNYAFYNTGLTEIDLSEKLKTIGDYAFYKSKLTSIAIPKGTTSIGQYAFCDNQNLESVVFEEGGKNVTVNQHAFSYDRLLKDVETNGRLAYIGNNAFYQDSRLEEFTIDPSVTEVRGEAFRLDTNVKRLEIAASPTNTALEVDKGNTGRAFASLATIEELVIDRDLTSQYKRTDEFEGLNPGVHVTVGKHVDNLDNMIVSALTSDTEVTFEGENDFTVTTRIDNRSADVKWSDLKGNFYVDPQGVLYQLNDQDNTASVFYIPKGITEYTVPSSITSVAGKTYSVNHVSSYAGRSAGDLTALTFEDPSKVTIPQFAFTDCTSLETINGKTELYPEEWTSVSFLCDFPVHTDETQEQVLTLQDAIPVEGGADDAAFSFAVTISNQEKMDEENPLTYVYPTGRSARFDFAISNESNADMSNRVIRVYFAFTGDNYTLGNYMPGDYALVNDATGARYPFKVRETDAKGVYYYDLTGFKPGDTLAFNNQFSYSSPTSGGGELRVWVESISKEEAEEKEGKTSQPTKYILADWYTKPTPYKIEKSVLGNPQFQYTANQQDENDENIYVKNVQYRIKLTSTGDSGTSYAKDYIKYVDMYDDLVLTENMVWNPDIIAAVEAGDYYYQAGSQTLFVRIAGEWITLCRMSFPNYSYVRNMHAEVVTDANGNPAVRIHWSYRNQYWTDTTKAPSADLPATQYDMYLGDQAIQVKQGSDLWKMFREGEEFSDEESAAMRQMANTVHETSHYAYSPDQYLEAETASRPIFMTTGFSMTKTRTGSSNYFGMEHGYNISMTNSGLVHKDDIDLVTDALRIHYYIEADDIESMLDDEKWGPFVTIDITSATFCEIPNVTATDIYGNDFTITDAQYSGIDPIPYNGTAPAGSDASEVTTNAKMSIHWDDTYTHKTLEVKDDAGTTQHTYTIGGGCDYATLDDAFKDLGYVVTYRAQYTVTWDLDEKYTLYKAHAAGVDADSVDALTEEQRLLYDYRLKSGRTDTLHIPSRTKRTDMFLVDDTPTYYNQSQRLSTNNYAYAKDRDGRQVGVGSWSDYIYPELQLTKSATANGTTFSQSIQIPDDTVLDYKLSFTNRGAAYDVLPLSDKMGGTQMLLVPVRTNRNAVYYPEGSGEGVALEDAGLDTYTSSGIEYYILDKAGSYKDVVIDGRTTDTVKVSRTLSGLETLMIWYFQDLTGLTSASSRTERNITYKALADSSRLITPGSDDDGSTITKNPLSNQSWLGGHQTHRLYASLYGESEQLQFKKSIVEDPEAAKENLISHSLIQDGDSVLYKIEIANTGDSEVAVRGNRLRDELPTTSGVFAWTKENVLDVYYVTEDMGSTIETVGPEYWYIDSTEPLTGADTASRGLYYLRWTKDFTINMGAKGKAWIYVRLQFPSSSDDGNAWDDYIAKNNGSVVTNYFYIDQRESHATHELADQVEAVLQKGVLDTGLGNGSRFQSEETRHYYQNGSNTVSPSAMQEVAYYTVLYNSGNVRLYLDKLYDQLPKGFQFRGLINGISRESDTDSNYGVYSNGYNANTLGSTTERNLIYYTEYFGSYANNFGSSSSYRVPVASVVDEKRDTIVYKNAQVQLSSSSIDEDGKQQLEFNISRYSDSYLNYDKDLKKFYLNPGEAIRFGYMCYVEGYANTDNVAENEIAMPVYDKYGLGVVKSDEEEVKILPATYRDIAWNDGGCSLTTTEEEMQGRNHAKPTWTKQTTDWLSSSVSLQRLDSVPGVQKTVGGETFLSAGQTIKPDEVYGSKYNDGLKTGTAYTGTVSRTSIVNWMIRAYNEGGSGSNSMEDYTIVDTVDAPYMFTGNFFYDLYSTSGTKITTGDSIPLFSLGGRSANDTTVKISTGSSLDLNSTITVNGPAVTVDNGRATVQLLRDENGVETIKVRMMDNYHRLPPNSYIALVAHTQYVSQDAVLSKQFYNHVQLEPSTEFDPALVSQGKVLYKDVDGDEIPYAIESGASVTMTAGYTSAARKQVTQQGVTSNTGWSDKNKNYIMLPEKYSKFYYDLYVDLPQDDPTSKLVLIDTLPEENDHSPFVDRDMRDSEFMVHITGEDPGFRVWSSANRGRSGKTELTYDQYKLEVTTRHEFAPEDWEGAGSGWTQIDLSDGVDEEETALLDAARSFRITLVDPDLLTNSDDALMGKNFQVQIRFNGELASPEDADPGAIAWNSFGYRYTVPIGATGMSTSLNAEPLKVGVMIPSVPYVIKDQKTPHNHYKAIDTATTYQFLIYKGTSLASLNDVTEMTPAEIGSVLAEAGRDFTIASLTVNGGEATGRTEYLDESKKWAVESGAFAETDENWVWENAAKYTVLELPWTSNGFQFSNIQHGPVNNYTFTQNEGSNVVLRVTNEYAEKGNLKLQKTVTGPSFDPERRFTFTIKLTDGRYPVYGSFSYTGTNIRDGALMFNDTGEASIQLKGGQAIELHDIPAGYHYEITEAEDTLYTSSSANASGEIITDATQEVPFLNTRKDTTLTITKNVNGNLGSRDQLFDFEVYIVDEGRELTGSYPVVIHHDNGTDTAVSDAFAEGALILHLQHGDRAEISGLPVGARYEVDELAASRVGYVASGSNTSGTLTETPVTSAWVNTQEGMIPTGGIDAHLPLFLPFVCAAGILFIFFGGKRRKRNKQEE